MPRRGRPRKPGPREMNGQPQRPGRDPGSTKVQSIRQWYVPGSGDPALSAYPLGVLLANGDINEREHAAACNYAWLHQAIFGRHSLAAISWEYRSRGRNTERDREVEERKLREIHEILRNHAPRRCRAALDNLAIYERLPRWMKPVRPREGDIADARFFKFALDLLVKFA